MPSRPTIWRLAWWAPNGFAAIPTTALDPPLPTASPALPALIGFLNSEVLERFDPQVTVEQKIPIWMV
jgi:hypothetical protein